MDNNWDHNCNTPVRPSIPCFGLSAMPLTSISPAPIVRESLSNIRSSLVMTLISSSRNCKISFFLFEIVFVLFSLVLFSCSFVPPVSNQSLIQDRFKPQKKKHNHPSPMHSPWCLVLFGPTANPYCKSFFPLLIPSLRRFANKVTPFFSWRTTCFQKKKKSWKNIIFKKN